MTVRKGTTAGAAKKRFFLRSVIAAALTIAVLFGSASPV